MTKIQRGKPDFAAVAEEGAPNVAYGEADLRQLAQAIGLDALAADTGTRLQQVAEAYLHAAMVDRDPGRKEKRAKLNRIARRVRALAKDAEAVQAELFELDAPTFQALKTPVPS
jgi:hypothetical protein